jgi:hypothetical protein
MYDVTINCANELNPLEVLIVADHYEKLGIKSYTMTKGNDCIWCYRGNINEYFIFRDGKLVDIQVD